jgi:hypothetical protein
MLEPTRLLSDFDGDAGLAPSAPNTVEPSLASHTARITAEIPEGWQLLQAHVVFRHGEKSFGDARNARAFPSYALQRPQDADLTERGVARMQHLGVQLRAFVDRARLSVDTPTQASLVCCNPKAESRHQHSLKEVARGVWPHHSVSLPARVYDVHTSDAPCRPEQMQQLQELWRAWRLEHAAEDDPTVKARPGVGALVEEATRLLAENSQWVPGKQNGPMHHLAIRLAYALQHSEEPLPPRVTAADYAPIARACQREDFELFTRPEPARLYCGPLLGELLDTVRHAAGQPRARSAPCAWEQEGGSREGAPRLFLYASHDYGVGPLASALGAPFSAWPDVGSFLLLEVLRHTSSGEVALRLTRNSEAVPSFLGLRAGAGGMVPWADAMPQLAARALDSDGSTLVLAAGEKRKTASEHASE